MSKRRTKRQKTRKNRARRTLPGRVSRQRKPERLNTIAKVEAAMEVALQESVHDGPAEVLERCPDGSRKVSLTPGMAKLMQLQLRLFALVFGREPGPTDPVFWDRDREHEGVFSMQEPDPHQMQQDMLGAGVRPAQAYAASRTGMIVTQDNQHLFTEEDLSEWDAAVEEYKSLQ